MTDNIEIAGNEPATNPEAVADGKKKRKPLTEEQKAKMQQARKDNEARRFKNTREAIITCFVSIENVETQKIVLSALEGKASKEQLQEMVDAKEITSEFMQLAIDCGIIKKPASGGKDALPYKWGSFRDYTEGAEGIEPNKELEQLLIELTGKVEQFRLDNKSLFDEIAEHTSVITGHTEAGSAITEGAEWMDYFRFPKSEEEIAAEKAEKEKKEAEAKAKADAANTNA